MNAFRIDIGTLDQLFFCWPKMQGIFRRGPPYHAGNFDFAIRASDGQRVPRQSLHIVHRCQTSQHRLDIVPAGSPSLTGVGS